jgi:uncharacterized membrane protein YdjX (TVP38/TMEM64 family)
LGRFNLRFRGDESQEVRKGVARRWALLALVLLALIIVPFVLLEEPILRWTNGLLAGRSQGLAATAVVLLLALDVLLPIPSSLVSTASGALLGLVPGTLVSTLGMTAGCLLGHLLGKGVGTRAASKSVGDAELARVRSIWRRHGDWTLVLLRAVPVLAEASVVFAGMAGMPLGRFLLITAASNACISAAYASAGAYALEARSFALAFGAAILLPFIGIMVAKRVSRGTEGTAR